jgi:hypothetical protein
MDVLGQRSDIEDFASTIVMNGRQQEVSERGVACHVRDRAANQFSGIYVNSSPLRLGFASPMRN